MRVSAGCQHQRRRQPQQPAHRERGRHDARQPPPRRGIDREAERREHHAGSTPARCSRRRARCWRRCRRRRTTGPARSPATIATASPFRVAHSGVSGIVAREERRRQRLDQHVGGQAERKPDQRVRGGRGVGGGEGAMFEQQPHHRLARARSIRASPAAPVRPRVRGRATRHARSAVSIVGAQRARQLGHQHGAHGDADDAERQFDQAVGEIQPRHRRGRASRR